MRRQVLWKSDHDYIIYKEQLLIEGKESQDQKYT